MNMDCLNGETMKESKIAMRSCLGIHKVKKKELARRAPLFLGRKCNAKCVFCYYADELETAENASLESIIKQIDFLAEYGIEDIEITGGEPTIHPNWFEILEYASYKFRHIACISNGIKFSDPHFMQKSHRAGLREILFSLHGYDPETHNSITRVPGSFVKIKKAIQYAHSENIIVRINSTVCNLNYKTLEDGAELLNELKPACVNYLPVNFWRSNSEASNAVSYEDMAPHIKRAIDKLNVKYINVRFIPYCFMEGYEKYVCNWHQHPYDHWDWNIELGDDLITSNEKKEELLSEDYGKGAVDYADNMRKVTYCKSEECMKCKYHYICDGVEKEVAETTEISIKTGDYITNPLFFRDDYCNIEEYLETIGGEKE